jgi:hypothetical protein
VKVKRLALERRALLALGARYQVVRLGSPPTILKHWRCINDGTVLNNADEYGSHVFLYPNHQIVDEK